MASGKTFKESYGASSEFKGGMVDPSTVLIVGLDLKSEDWNEDLTDDARLAMSRDSVEGDSPEAKAFIESILTFGVTDEIKVCKRRGMILAVDGRRRILGARRANEILTAKRSQVRIEVPIVVDKTDDQTVAMRLGNAFRLDDPPWVKAQEAARLRRMGKSEKDIAILSGGVEPVTLRNWEHYLNCVAEIQKLVESKALPFAVAIEIGKLGKGEKARQMLAFETLRNMGAKLTGEQGRENVKAVVERISDGSLTEAPVPQAPLPEAAPESPKAPPAANVGPLVPSHNPAPPKPSKAEPGPKAPPAAPAPAVNLATASRPKPGQILRLVALLEPTEEEPHETEADRLAYAIARIYAGQDPQCTGLEEWGDIQTQFQRALGVTKAKAKK